jgi:hypothetical protein
VLTDEQNLNIKEITDNPLREAWAKMPDFEDKGLWEQHEKWQTTKKPLIFKHKIGESKVVAVGVSHSKKLESPTTKGTSEAFQEYISETPENRRLIMVEGFHDREPQALGTFEKSVKHGGESWGITYLAKDMGVEVVSPEVPHTEVIEILKQEGIDPDLIALFYIMRSLGPLVNSEELSSEELTSDTAGIIYSHAVAASTEWMQQYNESELAAIRVDDEAKARAIEKIFAVCMSPLNATLNDAVGSELFDSKGNLILDAETLNSYHNPGRDAPDTIFKRISQIDNQARDEFLLREITVAIDKGKDPMVVFGGTHILRLEPALKHLEEK